ncbi:MAG TPA: hypothetical protein VMD25_14270 [Acidobacteriaceae bacterium]|nr:hypothetical protein [Acidobacteriaceae bacterium]
MFTSGNLQKPHAGALLQEKESEDLREKRPVPGFPLSRMKRAKSGVPGSQGGAIRAWRHAYNAAKHPGEVALIGKATAYRGLKNGNRRIVQQRPRAIDPSAEDKLMGRDMNRLFEQFGEVMRTHSRRFSQGVERYFAIEVRVNVFKHSIEAGSGKSVPQFPDSRRSHSVAGLKMQRERG